MSNHLYRPSAPVKKASTWWLPAILLLVVVVLCLNFVPRPQPHSNWKISTAQISDTRITNQGYRDAAEARPAEIYYRGEALVTYAADGKQYTVWAPATKTTTDRAWLSFVLSRRKDDTAEVKWNPSDPSQAEATLHLR